MPAAIPGTVVSTGSGVGPGGDIGSPGATGTTGATGSPGPSAVSADAGNLATLGSDSLISVPQSSIWSARLRSFNAIGNPTCEVDQRNAGSSPTLAAGTVSKFVCDRWNATKVAATAAVLVGQAQQASVVPGTSFRISSQSAFCQVSTAQPTLAAGEYFALQQSVEAPQLRELLGDVHSIQLLVASSVAGSYSLSLRNLGNTYSFVSLFTLAANTPTLVTIPNIPLWASGGGWVTAPGSAGYILAICLGAGSTFTAPSGAAAGWQSGNFLAAPGQTNWMATSIVTFYLAFIQHEPGAVCTTPIDKPFAQNYDECLRYYCKSYDYAVAVGTATAPGVVSFVNPIAASSSFNTHVPFPKPMAKVPTVTLYNHNTGNANSIVAPGAGNVTVSSVGNINTRSFPQVAITSGTGVVVGGGFFHYTADTGW
jgi:hypothetical protein